MFNVTLFSVKSNVFKNIFSYCKIRKDIAF